MFGFNQAEIKIFKKLSSPRKIQDFLDGIPKNFERQGMTCYSPRMVMRNRRAHCVEAACFAAAVMHFHGGKPLVVDLKAAADDLDHVIAPFKINNHWGAISKSNDVFLRYRDPVYHSIRELVMSYFNEYFLDDGSKTLRSWSRPIDLSRFDKRNWISSEQDLWYIYDYIDAIRHYPILTKTQTTNLRKTHPLERKAGRLKQWKK